MLLLHFHAAFLFVSSSVLSDRVRRRRTRAKRGERERGCVDREGLTAVQSLRVRTGKEGGEEERKRKGEAVVSGREREPVKSSDTETH